MVSVMTVVEEGLGSFQGDEVKGSNEHCMIMTDFDAKKNSRTEGEHAFDCQILAPVKH